MIWVFLFSITAAVIGAVVSSSKGYSAGAWFFLCLIFPPLILIPLFRSQNGLREPGSGERMCPHCAEIIKERAVICRYCGREVEPKKKEPMPPMSKAQKIILVSAIVLAAAFAVIGYFAK